MSTFVIARMSVTHCEGGEFKAGVWSLESEI